MEKASLFGGFYPKALEKCPYKDSNLDSRLGRYTLASPVLYMAQKQSTGNDVISKSLGAQCKEGVITWSMELTQHYTTR